MSSSFFGFNAALPRDRPQHQSKAPGFAQPQDPFAALSGRGDDQGEALNFDETYDGLGDQLDEDDDAFNDDTFGGGPSTRYSLGRDFDFAGQTAAKVADTTEEEQNMYHARQPEPHVVQQAKPPRPVATGYEKYKQPEYIPQLEASASIWGIGPQRTSGNVQSPPQQEQRAPPAASRKMMSLEEVEASMRAQSRPQQPPSHMPPSTDVPNVMAFLQGTAPIAQPQLQIQQPPQQFPGFAGQPQILQRPHQVSEQRPPTIPQAPVQAELPAQYVPQQPQILQRQSTPHDPRLRQNQLHPQHQQHARQESPHPRTILQNPNRLSGQGQPLAPHHRPQQGSPFPPSGPRHGRGPSFQGSLITDPQQIMNLSEADRVQFLAEEAKRAKRNHKIHLLGKDNGLMTPHDKNYITRIQLMQFVTATGNAEVDDAGPEAALAEDFYYQVYASIRTAPRLNVNQPANQFAQTYLFATHGRYGRFGGRGINRGDNHMQRMEQQVQRAVEVAKSKPKNKHLVIEGSLGKISFSNAKTPKPLLNIKRPDSSHERTGSAAQARPVRANIAVDRKTALRDIENVYGTLLQLEAHERLMPPPLMEESSADQIHHHMVWRQKLQYFGETLWKELKVMEPINPGSATPHPFIAILSHAKGKKAIPRIFRHIDEQQRVTILTMIVVHLDTLDVILYALPANPSDPLPPPQLPPRVRDEVDLFSQVVMPPLFAYVNDAPLEVIIGLLSLILERTNVANILRTKIGLAILTMLCSRAELVKQSAPPPAPSAPADEWPALFSRLFDAAEPVLPFLFPAGGLGDPDDVHVWQFLAAVGVGASPDQQQRLVLGVKERVMETVALARSYPHDLREKRLGDVNLFMRAIGLDVELLG